MDILDVLFPIDEGYNSMEITLSEGSEMSEPEAKMAYELFFGGDNEFIHFQNHDGKVILVGRKKVNATLPL